MIRVFVWLGQLVDLPLNEIKMETIILDMIVLTLYVSAFGCCCSFTLILSASPPSSIRSPFSHIIPTCKQNYLQVVVQWFRHYLICSKRLCLLYASMTLHHQQLIFEFK